MLSSSTLRCFFFSFFFFFFPFLSFILPFYVQLHKWGKTKSCLSFYFSILSQFSILSLFHLPNQTDPKTLELWVEPYNLWSIFITPKWPSPQLYLYDKSLRAIKDRRTDKQLWEYFYPRGSVRLNLFNHVLALFHAKFACISAIRYPIFRWESCKGCVWESVKNSNVCALKRILTTGSQEWLATVDLLKCHTCEACMKL